MALDSKNHNYKGVFDNRVGFGTNLAILVIDFVEAYVQPSSPFFAAKFAEAITKTKILIGAARQAELPIIFTVVSYQADGRDGEVFVKKVPALKLYVNGGGFLGQIAELIAPAKDALIISKQYASAFFGTSLASTLTSMKRDTLILTGCPTSGCIRATAVDGCQHGFHVIVPEECVGDRHPAPHEANLFDINAKYGDVVPLTKVMQHIESTRGFNDRTRISKGLVS